MNEEVKKRRKEKELQERMRQMEQENKRLPDNQNSMLNTFLLQNPSHSFTPNQNALQRTQNGSMSQLEAQIQLGQSPYNLSPLSLSRNQTHQRTHNGWSSSSTSSSTNSQLILPKPVSHSFPHFYNQPFLSSYHLPKNTSLHQTAPSPDLSSTNPLNEILDLTMSSPSPSTDSTDAGPSLDFNLALFPGIASDAPPPVATQQPLMLQHHQAAPQQHSLLQNQSLLTNNHDQDILEILGLALSPPMPPQKTNPSSSASTSSTSSLSNNLVSLFSIPSSSPSSSSSSSSSSLFSNSLPTPFLLQQSDPVSLPNGHSGALDVREALHSMLQAGQDRKSVIQYPQQD